MLLGAWSVLSRSAHHGEGVVLGVRLVGGPQVHRDVVDAGQHLGGGVPLGQLLGRPASCRGTGAFRSAERSALERRASHCILIATSIIGSNDLLTKIIELKRLF